MENKKQTYHIRIEYEGLGEYLYRELILSRDAMLRDIGLLIAVSFDTAMNREIRFEQNGRGLAVMTVGDKEPTCSLPSASDIRLRSLKLKAGSKLLALYDEELDHPFTVKVIGAPDNDEGDLPRLVDGLGAGVVEGMDPFHFLPVVRDLIAGGEPKFTYRSPSTGVLSEWDIRHYSIEEDRRRLSSRLALAAGMYK